MARSTSSSPSPPPTPFRRRTKTCVRKCERACCALATFFPLAFVYGLTTWAVWVEAGIGLKTPRQKQSKPFMAKPLSILGVALYVLLNTCYTVAAFTDPGSPLRQHPTDKCGYSSLPTVEPSNEQAPIQSITVSSTGNPRYCKKCQTPKPDRTHHCSTCRRCVLKMDHHCPWLATCLGLRNYKAFVLFLIYTTLFCWVCLLSSARWVWVNLFEENQYLEDFAPVNIIMLAVISGIIGLVLTGFTGWHLYLCVRGQTTIECLEKTRYLSGVRKQVERQRQDQLTSHQKKNSQGMTARLQRAGEQLLEFHANAVPGATRYEEGEEHSSPTPALRHSGNVSAAEFMRDDTLESSDELADTPAQRALRRTFSSMEQQRERDRYRDYLDEQESAKLPNAFDIGWRRNLSHLFGPKPLLWFLPVCNTTGDGWRWEISPKWIQANDAATQRRAQTGRYTTPTAPEETAADGSERASDFDLERGHAVSMKTLKRPGRAWGRARKTGILDQSENGRLSTLESSSEDDVEEISRRDQYGGRGRRWRVS